ncbi:unnamed protein product [Schistosoma bovis]|nr:unnamed protein product [Schistosoma bovis]
MAQILKWRLPLGITSSSSEFSGIGLLPGGPLIDLEYADDIVLFGEDADKMQSSGSTERQCQDVWDALLPSKCTLLLQNLPASTPELRKESEVVRGVNNFTYFGSLISRSGLVSDEISARIRKTRLAFANLRHLW